MSYVRLSYVVRTTYYVVRTTYYVVRTTYYVVRTTYYVVRTTYYVVRTTYLCRTYDLLCRTYDLLCRRYDLLCRTYDLLCRTYDLLCRTYDLLCRTYDIAFWNFIIVVALTQLRRYISPTPNGIILFPLLQMVDLFTLLQMSFMMLRNQYILISTSKFSSSALTSGGQHMFPLLSLSRCCHPFSSVFSSLCITLVFHWRHSSCCNCRN